MKENFASDYTRKEHVLENEKGGLFDRVENSGVKNIYIPKNINYGSRTSLNPNLDEI